MGSELAAALCLVLVLEGLFLFASPNAWKRMAGGSDCPASGCVDVRAGDTRDAEFYAFYRSLEAYREAFSTSNGTLVLDPKSEFLHYLQDSK